ISADVNSPWGVCPDAERQWRADHRLAWRACKGDGTTGPAQHLDNFGQRKGNGGGARLVGLGQSRAPQRQETGQYANAANPEESKGRHQRAAATGCTQHAPATSCAAIDWESETSRLENARRKIDGGYADRG